MSQMVVKATEKEAEFVAEAVEVVERMQVSAYRAAKDFFDLGKVVFEASESGISLRRFSQMVSFAVNRLSPLKTSCSPATLCYAERFYVMFRNTNLDALPTVGFNGVRKLVLLDTPTRFAKNANSLDLVHKKSKKILEEEPSHLEKQIAILEAILSKVDELFQICGEDKKLTTWIGLRAFKEGVEQRLWIQKSRLEFPNSTMKFDSTGRRIS